LMLPFGFSDSIFSTFDPVTISEIVWIYAKHVVRELLRLKI